MIFKEVSYSFKVWLSTVTVAPIILCAIAVLRFSNSPSSDNPFNSIDLPEQWVLLIAFIVFNGLFSVICLGLFMLIVKLTVSYSRSIVRSKYIISTGGFALCVAVFSVPYYVLETGMSPVFLCIAGCYSACVVGFSWFYDLPKPLPAEKPSLIENLNI
jgi:hypothetical protein